MTRDYAILMEQDNRTESDTVKGVDFDRFNHWISVENRLPEEATRVLVNLGGSKPPIGFPREDTDRVVDGRWVRWGELVTHWMPLPEPPKEEPNHE